MNLIAKKLTSLEFAPNEVICKIAKETQAKKELSGEKVFILYKGQAVRVTKHEKKSKIPLNDVFGSIFSSDASEDESTVYAQTAGEVLSIDQDEYDKIIADSILLQRIKNAKFIRGLHYLKHWDDVKVAFSEDLVSFAKYGRVVDKLCKGDSA